ncbi:transcriptional regulator family: Fungal Specific TF [Penicillium cataractarum]|uniref:Transcriptional regulator family: Fungal Specific TF n=1 Tax=Penicillium cataractarum TaxID=2100454 RepID=A0A9W9V5U4_9EURO|nr:transcriptional regulator family: Fungal Specific TF [Penicillium cataractarum]KAJ5368769.1 transcriptional regulator family: Fungal Specific TF [Penicillium cataractarum]
MAMDALRYMATGSDFAKNSLKYINDFQVVVNKALASMYRRDHGTASSARVSDSQEFGDSTESQETVTQSSMQPLRPPDSILLESHPEADPEDVDLSHHQVGQEIPRMAFFDAIETALENFSFTELHLLGFDCLYSSQVSNWDNVGP